jgi:hypothetical protein
LHRACSLKLSPLPPDLAMLLGCKALAYLGWPTCPLPPPPPQASFKIHCYALAVLGHPWASTILVLASRALVTHGVRPHPGLAHHEDKGILRFPPQTCFQLGMPSPGLYHTGLSAACLPSRHVPMVVTQLGLLLKFSLLASYCLSDLQYGFKSPVHT